MVLLSTPACTLVDSIPCFWVCLLLLGLLSVVVTVQLLLFLVWTADIWSLVARNRRCLCQLFVVLALAGLVGWLFFTWAQADIRNLLVMFVPVAGLGFYIYFTEARWQRFFGDGR